jgi:protoheme IX farnesyltransferase
MAYYSVITAFLRLLVELFISPVAAVVIFFYWVFGCCFAVKLYKLRTAKAAKALMLVSVGYITLLQLVYIIDKF